MNENLSDFLTEQNKAIAELRTSENLAWFNAITTGEKKFYEEYKHLAKKSEDFFNNKENFEKIKKYLDSDIEDKLAKRQLQILFRIYLGSQGDINIIKKIIEKSSNIEELFNKFRAKIGDKEFTDNEIKYILRNEKNSERLQKFWEASKEQGEMVAKELLEIIKLRNKLARNLGYGNYFEMSLELNEQKEEEIDKIFSELDKGTSEIFNKMKKNIDKNLAKKCGLDISELKPWHYQDLFFQESPDMNKINLDVCYNEDILDKAINFYNGLGLEVGDILNRSDLYEREGKYQHACCSDINKKGDVRIVENIKNNENWMETTLHELGHAVYDKYQNFELPYLLIGPAHILVTEAIALLFGRVSKNSFFIKKHCKSNDEDTKKLAEYSERKMKFQKIIFSRWCQVMYHFEKELYKNPNQNLNQLWWRLVKQYQQINFSRDKPDWASKIHFVSSPVYYHNYLLGEIFASQVKSYILKNIFGEENHITDLNYENQKIGEYLKKEIFQQGKKYSWDRLIKQATKEELTAKYFLKEFC